jgi:hypothetical protein
MRELEPLFLFRLLLLLLLEMAELLSHRLFVIRRDRL